jgi:ABC-2 type transport system permease protein
MKKIYKIAHTELQTLFYSPIAWLILVIFAVQTGMAFTSSYEQVLKHQMMGDHYSGITFYIFNFKKMLDYLYLYIPLLTMGLMSRELSSGSIKLLYSSPVSNTQIILGKYLAMLIYGLTLVGMIFMFSLFGIFTIKDIDTPVIWTSLSGIYLLICAYAAIGLFMSCLTSYQVVAAMGTLALFAALNYVNQIGQGIQLVRDITYWLSLTGRADALLNGLINSEDVLYFLIVVSLFVILSILKLNADRMKRGRGRNSLKYLTVTLVAMALGYFSSRPMLMGFYDVTRTKSNTLTPNSQAIIKKLKGPLTITTYVNLFEQNYYEGLPTSVNFDKEHFKQYIRFKPDTRMKYVYYYDKTDHPASIAEYPGLTDKQRMERECTIMDLDPKLFLSPKEIGKIIDLSSEHNRFVRVLETEDGKQGRLRLFNDMRKHPDESEITAALKRMVMKLPTVAFLQGHGAREIDNTGDRGYYNFAKDGFTRSALINQGFDFVNVDLSDGAPVPDSITALVIADLKTPLTDTENVQLTKYIQRGGNLLIAGEPGRQESMGPLLSRFGVSLMPGRLVQLHDNYVPDLVLSQPTDTAVKMSYHFNIFKYYNGVITMPGASGLQYSTDKGYQVTPWFMTGPDRGWNELETTNFIDDQPTMNAAAGETEKSYPTVLALSREKGGHQQKIIILGDADCLSNTELGANRKDLRAMNETFVQGVFSWLSDGAVPIDVRRPPMTDDHVNCTLGGMAAAKLFFVWILPGLLAVAGSLIWAIRKRR